MTDTHGAGNSNPTLMVNTIGWFKHEHGAHLLLITREIDGALMRPVKVHKHVLDHFGQTGP